MKSLIKKILKESGFLDSTEEDWEWSEGGLWDGEIHKGQNYHYTIPKNSISNDEWIRIQSLIVSLGVDVSETRSEGDTNPMYNGYEDIKMGAAIYVDSKGAYHKENFMPLDDKDWVEYVEDGSIEILLEHLLLLSKR